MIFVYFYKVFFRFMFSIYSRIILVILIVVGFNVEIVVCVNLVIVSK